LGGKVKSFSPFGAVDPGSGVQTVSVNPGDVTTYRGSTVQLAATALDADGKPVTGRSTSWSSSDPTIASISQTGLVTGTEIGGPVTIMATIDGKSGISMLRVGCLDNGQPVACGTVRLRLDAPVTTGTTRFDPSSTNPGFGTSWLKCTAPKLIVEGGDGITSLDLVAWNFYLAENPSPEPGRPTLPADWFVHALSAHSGDALTFWRFSPEWGVGPVESTWRHRWQDLYRFTYTVLSNKEVRSTDLLFQCI
jgi:hypothetical protein